MRIMYIVTSSQPMRGPTPALMEAMGKLADREIKAGRMLDTGGLMPVSMGAQVKITDGKLSVVDGPFVETKHDRRLRDLRTPGQARGRGFGEGIHAVAPRSHAGLGRDLRGPPVRDARCGRCMPSRRARPRVMRAVDKPSQRRRR